ncbi:MAG: RHS repeat-associated core domain-containing protein [Bryobacterales bacterium]|nr:RHS repeat-associated core domain-containing protein [Bryobacterales bacterium]
MVMASSRFTGKERDAETGLDYFGARYMSSAQGRFTSPDIPLIDQHVQDPQSWNLYGYVRNNPLRYTDPTGRCLRPNETVDSCADYLLGGAKAIGNVPSDIVNSPNRLANLLIAPFTDFRFADLIPTTFTPTNEDQRQGMEAMAVAMVVTPVAEAAAERAASATATVALETGAASHKAGVQANKVAGDAFRDQVAAGLAAVRKDVAFRRKYTRAHHSVEGGSISR